MAVRTVLISGTSTGIGEACVHRLAAAGWHVYAGVRRPEDGERLVADHQGEITPLPLDVTDAATIDAAVDAIRDAHGGLDGLVNNAGIAVGGPIEVLGVDEWRRQFEVNVFGLVALTHAAFPLVDAADGRFVHIGSIGGRVAAPGIAPYNGTKFTVEAYNWALRAELRHLGRMQSSVVEPGEIKTAIWDKGEQQMAEIQARLAAQGLTERYQWLLDLTSGFVADAQRRGGEPDLVARAVEHALTSRRPKARYLVGTDAKIQAAIARLPDRAREFVLAKAAAPLAKQGRELRSA